MIRLTLKYGSKTLQLFQINHKILQLKNNLINLLFYQKI